MRPLLIWTSPKSQTPGNLKKERKRRMCKFVEFHETKTGARVAIDVFTIVNVMEYKGNTVIYLRGLMGSHKEFSQPCYVVSESYVTVMNLIREATAYQNI